MGEVMEKWPNSTATKAMKMDAEKKRKEVKTSATINRKIKYRQHFFLSGGVSVSTSVSLSSSESISNNSQLQKFHQQNLQAFMRQRPVTETIYPVIGRCTIWI